MAPGLGDALTAFGLVLVIEGLVFAAAPEAAKRGLATLLSRPATLLRNAGLATMAAGVVIVWLVRG